MRQIDWGAITRAAATKAFTAETHGGNPSQEARQAALDELGQQIVGSRRDVSVLAGATTGAVNEMLYGERDPKEIAKGAGLGALVNILSAVANGTWSFS